MKTLDRLIFSFPHGITDRGGRFIHPQPSGPLAGCAARSHAAYESLLHCGWLVTRTWRCTMLQSRAGCTSSSRCGARVSLCPTVSDHQLVPRTLKGEGASSRGGLHAHLGSKLLDRKMKGEKQGRDWSRAQNDGSLANGEKTIKPITNGQIEQ